MRGVLACTHNNSSAIIDVINAGRLKGNFKVIKLEVEKITKYIQLQI